MCKATVVFSGRPQDGEVIEVNGHELQVGGSGGDGYCYKHQSFKCAENLTEEEKEAIKNAE